MMVLSRSFKGCPRIRPVAVADVHLRFSSLRLCDQFSSVAVDGHCREYGCIVHVSTQCPVLSVRTAICRNVQRCISPCHTVWSSVSIYRLSCEFSVVLSDVSLGIIDDQLG